MDGRGRGVGGIEWAWELFSLFCYRISGGYVTSIAARLFVFFLVAGHALTTRNVWLRNEIKQSTNRTTGLTMGIAQDCAPQRLKLHTVLKRQAGEHGTVAGQDFNHAPRSARGVDEQLSQPAIGKAALDRRCSGGRHIQN